MKYVATRPMYVGSISLKEGNVITATSEGVVFGSRVDKNCNPHTALQLGWLRLLEDGEKLDPTGTRVITDDPSPSSSHLKATPPSLKEKGEKPVENVVGNTPQEPKATVQSVYRQGEKPSFNPSKYKVERVESNDLDVRFDTPTKPAPVQREVSTIKRDEIQSVQDYVDLGDNSSVRQRSKQAAEVAAENVIEEDGIRVSKPKPFSRKVVPIDAPDASEHVTETASSEFEWDMNAHWRTRVKKALEIKESDPATFQRIYDMEVESVRKHIE